MGREEQGEDLISEDAEWSAGGLHGPDERQVRMGSVDHECPVRGGRCTRQSEPGVIGLMARRSRVQIPRPS